MSPHFSSSRLAGFGLLGLLAGCSPDVATPPVAVSLADSAAPAVSARADDCAAEEGIDYICGLINPEDLVSIPGSPWVLVSGMNGEVTGADHNGRVHAVHTETHEVRVLFPGDSPQLAWDRDRFSVCPGEIDATNISVHGLSLRDKGNGLFDIYVTSHGAREAIEVFELRTNVEPELHWSGCVPIEGTGWMNSVVILEDGGFMTTQFMDAAAGGMGAVVAGEISGQVFHWDPGSPRVQALAGTELSGANGIEVDSDERYLFVAAYGSGQVLRYDLSDTQSLPVAAEMPITPDNLRWTERGTLLTAGSNLPEPGCQGGACATGWSVYEIDPGSMQAERIAGAGPEAALQGASTALQVGDSLWVGSYAGDRVAILPYSAKQ